MDPLQKQFETVSAEGQSFVQSAPSGVDTSEMESDLEVLGDKWSELAQKVGVLLYPPIFYLVLFKFDIIYLNLVGR